MNIINYFDAIDAGFCRACTLSIPQDNLVTTEHGHIFHVDCFRNLFQQHLPTDAISCVRCTKRVYEYEEFNENTTLNVESFSKISNAFYRATSLEDLAPFQFYNSGIARTLFEYGLDGNILATIITVFNQGKIDMASSLVDQNPKLLKRFMIENPETWKHYLAFLPPAIGEFLTKMQNELTYRL